MMKPAIQFASRSDRVKIAYATFGTGPPLVCPAAWVTDLSFFLKDPYLLKFWSALSEQYSIILYDKVVRHHLGIHGSKFQFTESEKFRPKGINEEIKLFEVNWSE